MKYDYLIVGGGSNSINGFRQEGFAAFDRNVRRGCRLSAARAYLYPTMKCLNLTVKTKAMVMKVIYAPVMMVAEKAADLILGNDPLPPENLEFYRHKLA